MSAGRYTSSHSLDELSVVTQNRTQFRTIHLTATSKDHALLDHYLGAYSFKKFAPRSKSHKTRMASTLLTIGPQKVDPDDCNNDWVFLKEAREHDDDGADFLRQINALMEAERLARRAFDVIDSDSTEEKDAAIQKAMKASDLCVHALVLKYVTTAGNDPDETGDMECLIQAIEAGRRLKELIAVDDICKADLFSFLPTRWYVRSLFLCGSLFYRSGALEEAESYLQEYLDNDKYDALGARHKLLLLHLEREGIAGEEIPNLLKMSFGNESLQDDQLALWNYTRALHSFTKKGRHKVSDRFLKHAIKKNPYVPLLLLGSDLLYRCDKLIALGTEMEATDYVLDNTVHWQSVDGALDWLQDFYCKTKGVLPSSLDLNKGMQERCFQCQTNRSNGKPMRLSVCKSCNGPAYCSKQCQTVHWKSSHKYYCTGSKNCVVIGSEMFVKDLGKMATITSYQRLEGTFGVELINESEGEGKAEDEQSPEKENNEVEESKAILYVKPSNLQKVRINV